MILHLVTASHRLYSGADPAASRACLLRQVYEAIAAGVDVIQIRERTADARALADLVLDGVALARGSSTRIIVNERLDVALACGAGGVHLRSDSLPAAAVRRVAPEGFLIGRSVHAPADAASAGPVDYLVAGTVWPSASKPDATGLLGVEGLAAIVRASAVPVVAIGGVTLQRLPLVAASGAVGVAGIGLFMNPEDQARPCRAGALAGLVAAARARFDTPPGRS